MDLIIIIIIAAVVLILLSQSVKLVKQSEVLLVERLGKYHKTARSGLNFIVPVLDKLALKVDLRIQVLDSPPQPVITRDNVTMEIDTVVYYQVTDPFRAVYEIKDLNRAIRYLITTTLRDIIGTMELDQTLSSREKINGRLRTILDEATDKWGVRVDRVEVKNIDISQDIRDAMEKQMRAEREKRAQILEAEGKKQAAITTAEGNNKAMILEAEANKESQIREAEGEAEKIKLIFNALKEADIDEKMLSLKYIDAITEMAKGENKVFMPYEASGLMSAAGTLKDLFDKKQKKNK
jgi:regulator of protease activity HflC (stomatin/prohibitin superfamily)